VVPAELSDAVCDAVRAAVTAGDLQVPVPDAVPVRRPGRAAGGDYVTSAALRLAAPAGLPATEVAGVLARRLRGRAGISAVEIAGPGFLNVTVEHPGRVVERILAEGPGYGRSAVGGAEPGPDEATGPDAGPPGRIGPDAGPPGRIGSDAGPPGRIGSDAGPLSRVGPDAGLVDRIGLDAARYAVARGGHVDVERWARRTEDNPLFGVQYSHSRAAAMGRNAAELGIAVPSTMDFVGPGEHELLVLLAEFPPPRLPAYLEELAGAYLRYAAGNRILPFGDEPVTAVTQARLLLSAAVRTVLANGLDQLGVSAPEYL
jgi:arginyl-tRNA synthetase